MSKQLACCTLYRGSGPLLYSYKPLEPRQGEPRQPSKAHEPLIVPNSPYWAALAPPPLAPMAYMIYILAESRYYQACDLRNPPEGF